MNNKDTYQERYMKAEERVEKLRSFYNHLIVFVFINLAIMALNYYHNQWQFAWFIFPLLGWGIGLSSHAIATFGGNPFTNKKWEERKIKEFMENEP